MSFPKNALSGASLALVAILFAPLAARAADKTVLRPMFDLEQGWDSNIYNDSDSEQGSLVTRFSPALWLENSGELGFARLGVTLVGRSVWEESELSRIDSGVRGTFDRKLTPRLSLFGDGRLDYYSGYEEIGEGGTGGPSGLPGEVLLGEAPSWTRDQADLGFRYLLAPRTSLELSGGAGRVNFERVSEFYGDPNDPIESSNGEYRDRSLRNVRASLRHQLTARDEVGLTAGGDDTEYQDLGTGSNDSRIWNARLLWNRNWSPLWSTQLSIGGRMIDSTQEDVPQNAGYGYLTICVDPLGFPYLCSQRGQASLEERSFSGSGSGLIGGVAIQRTFERTLIRLSYDRDTRSTGGSGRTNFDIDAFTLTLTHRLAERVKLSISGNYSLYHSVTDELPSYAATVNPSITGTPTFSCAYGGSAQMVGETAHPQYPGEMIDVYQCFGGSSEEDRAYTILTGRIDWQMRRKLSSYLVARYYHATTDYRYGSGSEISLDDDDKITIGVGLRYAWDLPF